MMYTATVCCFTLRDAEVLMEKFDAAGMRVFLTEGVTMSGLPVGNRHRSSSYRLDIDFWVDLVDLLAIPDDYEMYMKGLKSADCYFNAIYDKIIRDTDLILDGQYQIQSPIRYGLTSH